MTVGTSIDWGQWPVQLPQAMQSAGVPSDWTAAIASLIPLGPSTL